MPTIIKAFTQHALDRFKQRSGIRFRDDGHACEKLWEIAQHAERVCNEPNCVIYHSKGWRMKVKGKTILTMFLSNTVRRKRQVYATEAD